MGRQVVIVDDQDQVIDTITRLLHRSGWGPITSATTPADGIAALEQNHPDLVIVDLDVQERDGAELPQVLQWVHAQRYPPGLLVVSSHDTVDEAVASIRAGARGFVPKGSSQRELLQAVAAVAGGGGWVPNRLLGGVLTALLEPAAPNEWEELVARLTLREREVMDLMVAGYSRPSIARQLDISLNTVRTHTKNILSKLGVHSSLEAVSVALKAGIRPHDEA